MSVVPHRQLFIAWDARKRMKQASNKRWGTTDIFIFVFTGTNPVPSASSFLPVTLHKVA